MVRLIVFNAPRLTAGAHEDGHATLFSLLGRCHSIWTGTFSKRSI
jgi:hypothetical protein